MDLAEKLFLHSQVSVKEFSELILEMTPPLQPNFVSSFNTGLYMYVLRLVFIDIGRFSSEDEYLFCYTEFFIYILEG